jgi:ectoine hydroxylase-related dioxygenase (phytanoyl-CoA dioxygenase family)
MNAYVSHLMPHTWDNRIMTIAKIENIISSTEIFIKGKVDLLHSQITFKAPGDLGFSNHQDNYFNRAKPSDSMIAVWLALDDADKENGALVAYPTSHLEGILPVTNNWKHTIKEAPKLIRKVASQFFSSKAIGYDTISGFGSQWVNTVIPNKYHALTVDANARSLVFMHGNLIHSSGTNQTKNRFRRNLLLNYALKGSKFKAGILSKRQRCNVY